MILRATVLFLILATIVATPLAGEDWGVGATVGLVNDIEEDFHLDAFDTDDVNAWVEFRLDEQVVVRGTIGSLKVPGENAGLLAEVIPGAELVRLPDLETRMDYVTVGASYQFWEGDYTSGLFGGIGGYRVDPDPAPAGIADFRDPRETAFGWHLGVDADLRVLSRLSFVARLTYHRVESEFGRSLLAANAGAVFRF